MQPSQLAITAEVRNGVLSAVGTDRAVALPVQPSSMLQGFADMDRSVSPDPVGVITEFAGCRAVVMVARERPFTRARCVSERTMDAFSL